MEDVRAEAQNAKLGVNWLFLVILVLRKLRQENYSKVRGEEGLQMFQLVKVLAPKPGLTESWLMGTNSRHPSIDNLIKNSLKARY